MLSITKNISEVDSSKYNERMARKNAWIFTWDGTSIEIIHNNPNNNNNNYRNNKTETDTKIK